MKIKYPTKTYSLIQLMDGKMAQEIILEGQWEINKIESTGVKKAAMNKMKGQIVNI
jgi:hypothetical protein